MDGIGNSTSIAKLERKIDKINIHLQTLFLAVQNGQVEKAKSILASHSLDVNSVDSEISYGITLLEMAVMKHEVELVKLLQKAGATDTKTCGELQKYIKELVIKTEKSMQDLEKRTDQPTKEREKQRDKLTRKSSVLKELMEGLESLEVPKEPTSAFVEVIDSTRVKVNFSEPTLSYPGITTKFKVEYNGGVGASGYRETSDLRRMSVEIDGLEQGRRYDFKVSAGSTKGYGKAVDTIPHYIVPSSWRDIDKRKPRFDGLLREFDNLFNQVRNSRPENASEIKAIDSGIDAVLNQRRGQNKKKTIMQLFAPTPKFHKNLKRGCFLCCVLWSDDKVLVTNEDFLPVIEVDENYPGQVQQDLKWLMEVATTWEDVKNLKHDMEQAGSVSSLPFRSKLLQAAANMQSALGVQDLGQFYYETIKDSQGGLVFCTVRQLHSTKMISSITVKWLPVNKLKERKQTSISPSTTPGDAAPLSLTELLLQSVSQQIAYDKNSRNPLPRGLYLGYLKLHSSMEQLRVFVPLSRPNLFPNVKIRDNTHISKEEWEWLKDLGGETSNDTVPTPAQRLWQNQLSRAALTLIKQLGVDDREHRLYTSEVIDLSSDVSFILLLPNVDDLFCNAGQQEKMLETPDLLLLPLHTFEVINMATYQSQLLGRYARLKCILEMDRMVAEHAKRESFSQNEMEHTQKRLSEVQSFEKTLEEAWKQLRWIKDAISFARDKSNRGVLLSTVVKSASTHGTTPRNQQGNFSAQTMSYVPSSPSSPPFQANIQYCSMDFVQPPFDRKFSKNERPYTAYYNRSMKKSITSENIRDSPKAETGLVKSKTSECIFSRDGLCESPPLKTNEHKNSFNRTTVPSVVINEHTGNPLSQMYNRDTAIARSEHFLNDRFIPDFPFQRKSSAPPDLECRSNHLSHSRIEHEPFQRSEARTDVGDHVVRHRKETILESKEAAVKTVGSLRNLCGNFSSSHPHYQQNIHRADSTLSHGSNASLSSMTTSLKSISSTETETDTLSLLSRESCRSEASEAKATVDDETVKRIDDKAIIQVHAAYDTGLSTRVSVKLQVTNKTTAREVIDLVVKRLNLSVVEKGKRGPTYGNEKLENFCLVAVINKRERILRDDFKLLGLQDPWKQGKLYIRFKTELLAALEQCSSKHCSTECTYASAYQYGPSKASFSKHES